MALPHGDTGGASKMAYQNTSPREIPGPALQCIYIPGEHESQGQQLAGINIVFCDMGLRPRMHLNWKNK